MTEKLQIIEIFCEDHGRISKIERASQIACYMTGHYLAFGFPYDRIWEYCCDCEVFQASKMSKGKAATDCRICRREVARRYMCHNCQTISFESDQPPRGKRQPSIQDAEPATLECRGCSSKPGNEKLVYHYCPVLGLVFLTARLDCLFCHRQTDEPFVAKTNGLHPAAKTSAVESGMIAVECPNKLCRNLIPADSVFCPSCGTGVKRCAAAVCGKPLHPGSVFCPYCGTPALRKN
jgi:hypothetical protein